MSDADQEPEDNRHRRLLCRALVVAGATVAGTTAIWLAGVAASAETAAPAPALGEESTVDSGSGAERSGRSGWGESGPGAFRVGDLDPARLLLDPSQPSGANVVEVVAAPVGGLLHEAGGALTSPVREVGEALPKTIHNGLDGVRRPLLRAVTNAPVSSGALPGVVDSPHVGGTPPSPVGIPPAAPAQSRSAVGTDVEIGVPAAPGVELTAAGTGPGAVGAPRSDDAGEPRAFTRPATTHPTSGATGSAGSTDWPGQGVELHGRSLQAANLGAVPPAGLGDTTRIPTGRPPAQPGTTPD